MSRLVIPSGKYKARFLYASGRQGYIRISGVIGHGSGYAEKYKFASSYFDGEFYKQIHNKYYYLKTCYNTYVYCKDNCYQTRNRRSATPFVIQPRSGRFVLRTDKGMYTSMFPPKKLFQAMNFRVQNSMNVFRREKVRRGNRYLALYYMNRRFHRNKKFFPTPVKRSNRMTLTSTKKRPKKCQMFLMESVPRNVLNAIYAANRKKRAAYNKVMKKRRNFWKRVLNTKLDYSCKRRIKNCRWCVNKNKCKRCKTSMIPFKNYCVWRTNPTCVEMKVKYRYGRFSKNCLKCIPGYKRRGGSPNCVK